MATKTLKALREEAEAALAEGVKNLAELKDAVPKLVALQNAVKAASERLKETQAVVDELVKATGSYAKAHSDYVFGSTYSVSPIGVESGDLDIDGTVYHYSLGYDGFRRTESGVTMSQEFLSLLPPGWTKGKLFLDTGAIKREKPSAEALAERGLERKPKESWTELG